MNALAPDRQAPRRSAVPVLRLENGARLTAPEFLRRYEATPRVTKAELIEGIVFMPPPVSFVHHSRPDRVLQTWLGLYIARTPGLDGGPNSTVKLDMDNVPQPDAMLFIEAGCGGQAEVGDDDYLHGAPELVIEIASSSASIDLHDKYRAYRRNGVREYLVWLAEQDEIRWFVLDDGEFVRIEAGSKGLLRSRQFPGLWLNVTAAIKRDAGAVVDTLEAGLKSKGHRDFVAALAASRKKKR